MENELNIKKCYWPLATGKTMLFASDSNVHRSIFCQKLAGSHQQHMENELNINEGYWLLVAGKTMLFAYDSNVHRSIFCQKLAASRQHHK